MDFDDIYSFIDFFVSYIHMVDGWYNFDITRFLFTALPGGFFFCAVFRRYMRLLLFSAVGPLNPISRVHDEAETVTPLFSI